VAERLNEDWSLEAEYGGDCFFLVFSDWSIFGIADV